MPALSLRLRVAPGQLRTAIDRVARRRAAARREERRARRLDARVVTLGEPGYPSSLLDLELPPPALYLRGRIPDAPAIAIVGSRDADPYGLEAARSFAAALARHGIAIVSGFARGVDAAAHRGALEAADGRTVAVLGCGLDIDYPRGSRRLGDRIARRGALVTEFPIGFTPRARNFPIRNRLIAALSLGTLVVRATVKSGSLITARLALELGRDVYAVPGGVYDDRARGPNLLIRDGALLAQSPRDIVESLPDQVARRLRTPEDDAPRPVEEAETPAERLLRELPRGEPCPAERPAARAGVPIEVAIALLLELELEGLVRRYPGPRYCRAD